MSSAGPEPLPVVEKAKPQKKKREKVKADPKHVAAARELRDRWLERVNAGQYLPQACGKYEVSRMLAADGATDSPIPALPAPPAPPMTLAA